jgi:hypothetical protein
LSSLRLHFNGDETQNDQRTGTAGQERFSDDSTAEFSDNLFLLGLTVRY